MFHPKSANVAPEPFAHGFSVSQGHLYIEGGANQPGAQKPSQVFRRRSRRYSHTSGSPHKPGEKPQASSNLKKPSAACAAALIVVVGVTSGVLLMLQEIDGDNETIAHALDTTMLEHLDSFRARFGSTTFTMEMLSLMFAVNSTAAVIDTDTFGVFAGRIAASRPETFAISFTPKVLPSERAEFEARHANGYGFVNRTIYWPNYPGSGASGSSPVMPAPDTVEFYLPFTMSTALAELPSAYLYDAYNPSPANLPRRETIDIAIATGTFAATEIFPVTDEFGEPSLGVVLFFPVFPHYFEPGAPNSTPEERREKLSGVVTFVMLLENLATNAFFQFASRAVEVAVLVQDVTDPAAPTFIYALIETATGAQRITEEGFYACAEPGRELRSGELEVGQRTWLLSVVALPEFEDSRRTAGPYIILATCLFITLVGVIAVVVTMQYVRLKALAFRRSEAAAARFRREQAAAVRQAHEKSLRFACHELRNPLHAISASIGFLVTDPSLSKTQKEDVEAIQHSAQQMHRLVNEVLDMAKLRSGQLTLSPTSFDIRHMLRSLGRAFAPMAYQGVRFTCTTSPQVPIRVMMDELRARQLLSNGITNALKLTRSGFVALQVDADTSSHTLYFQVLDSGPGLQGKEPHTLFDPTGQTDMSSMLTSADVPGFGKQLAGEVMDFQRDGTAGEVQLSSDSAHARSGSNFGLPIALQLAKLMNGSVMLDECNGHTVFCVVLPYQPVQGSDFAASDVGPESSKTASTRCKTPDGQSSQPDTCIVNVAPGPVAPIYQPPGVEHKAPAGVVQGHRHSSRNVLLAPISPASTHGSALSPAARALPLPQAAEPTSTGTASSGSTGLGALSSAAPATASVAEAAQNSSRGANSRPGSAALSNQAVATMAPSGAIWDSSSMACVPQRSSPSPGPGLPNLGAHVLFVEDERLNLRYGLRMLSALGCTAVPLDDGVPVVSALVATGQLSTRGASAHMSQPPHMSQSPSVGARKPFDCILLDIQMREQSGDEVCVLLRQLGLKLPIIAMTGNCSHAERREYLEMGFSAMLGKPFDVNDLAAVLHTQVVLPRLQGDAAGSDATGYGAHPGPDNAPDASGAHHDASSGRTASTIGCSTSTTCGADVADEAGSACKTQAPIPGCLPVGSPPQVEPEDDGSSSC